MKTNGFFLLCLILSSMAFGQNNTKELKGSENVTNEISARFLGIKDAAVLQSDNSDGLSIYILNNLDCPKQATECGIEGTEIIRFLITADGKLTDFEVINSVSPQIDKEVIRVLAKTEGMWIPGFIDGQPVAMEKEVELLFGNCNEGKFVEYFTQKATKHFNSGNKNFLEKNNPKKALAFYNKAVRYLPNDLAVLTMRGLCQYELGDITSAKKDWDRLVVLGKSNYNNFDLIVTESYAELEKAFSTN